MTNRFPPYYYNPYCRIYSENSKNDPESAVLHDNLSSSVISIDTPCGLFNDKHQLHVIPHPAKQNVFMNRISYDTRSDTYYENGIKYIEFWDRGAYSHENLIYVYDFSEDRTNYKDMVALYPNNLRTYPSIIYKFDYTSCENFEITSLSLKLNCVDDNFDSNWIISISTNFNFKDCVWITVDESIDHPNKLHSLTRYVRNKRVFYIKFEIKVSGKSLNFERNINLFPQSKYYFENDDYNVKDNFELDIIVEFSPQRSNVLSKMLNLNVRSKEREIPIRSLNCINSKVKCGLFNDKYAFNVVQYENNLYTHSISYNAYKDAYYENGNAVAKYLKRWNRGAFTHENIYYFPEFSQSRRSKTLPAYITWKFDYRPGNFYIISLELIIKFHHSTNIRGVQWFIQLLSTVKNPNPEFMPIVFSLQKNKLDYNLDLTEMVKDGCGFILKAYIKEKVGFQNNEMIQLFKQDEICHEEKFCMDIKVKLEPNIICDPIQYNDTLDKNFMLNDKMTSDFTIKLTYSNESESEANVNEFYVHTAILASESDYFKALLNSNMLESKKKCVYLVDISYFILEKMLLYIYTHNLDDHLDFDVLVDLLYASSRFFVLRLIQLCEILISKFVNYDNFEEILELANKCGAFQLAKYCENFVRACEPVRPVKKFKGVFTSLARKMKRL
ncbi:18947_t:CDS:2 [Funneliformis geosporum]|nr:18947_t:CDS:2 [Funneliformis geosporum]